jgi:hypothetical protein
MSDQKMELIQQPRREDFAVADVDFVFDIKQIRSRFGKNNAAYILVLA